MSNEFWESLAQSDPLWAILSAPDKAGRRWDLDEFFETGRREISLLLYRLRQFNAPFERAAALDFGCGVGRLTQAMAATFDSVVGVDASATMIRLADSLNRHPDRVSYVRNDVPHLRVLPSASIDFINSDIVLQHIEPTVAVGYLRELVRLLRPNAVMVFQLPSEQLPAADTAVRPQAMTSGAYAAELRLHSACPAALAPGAYADLLVGVRNVSDSIWPGGATGLLRVGNHWLTAEGGTMLLQDDGRSELPVGMLPGETCEVALRVQAPAEPGDYLCEIDVVHEGVTWFSDRKSSTLRAPITVRQAPEAGAATEPPVRATAARLGAREWPDIYDSLRRPVADEPIAFPMYGIPRDEVVALMAAVECPVFQLESDDRARPEWNAYRYFARKSRG